jgi:hypothetical protein
MDTNSPIIPEAEARMQKLESNFTEMTLTLQLFLTHQVNTQLPHVLPSISNPVSKDPHTTPSLKSPVIKFQMQEAHSISDQHVRMSLEVII